MKTLPACPHLDHLKKQARLLLEGVRHGAPEALGRMRLALPAASPRRRKPHPAATGSPARRR